MIQPIVHGLSNDRYHNGEEERQYLSSTLLKRYKTSPKAYKHAVDNPGEDKSGALRFGSLFHDLMACLAEENGDWRKGFFKWKNGIATFDPPVNPKTNTCYGATTKVYTEAYEKFLASNQGKTVAHILETDLAGDMADSLLKHCGATSEQVRKLLKWGEPEVSFFYETEDGIKLKVRPDLLTKRKIIDWKTATSDDLTEESINRTILRYGYHISAAMYQYVVHEILGKWLDFILVIVSKIPPYDCVMVDMANYGYRHYPDVDIISMGPGAMEFKKLLDLHVKCTKENNWPGVEQSIPDNNGVRILEIQPPRYYANRFIEEI